MNSNTHLYLYAKGHYHQSSDIMHDLQIIMSERCGQYNKRILAEDDYEEFLVRKQDVMSVITSITFKFIQHSGNTEHYFKELIENASPQSSWKVGYKNKANTSIFRTSEKEILPDYDYWTAMAYACLSFLRFLDLKTIKDVDGENIGDADFELFPMFDFPKT